jgi:hypothetical protein
MALDSVAILEAVVDVLETLTDLGHVQIGAPQSVGPRVSAWVSLGGHQMMRKATGITQRETRVMVMFCYRIDDAEDTAETTLAGLVDDFMAAVHDDLTLGGAVVDARTESPAADEPDYQLRAGKEYREYPVIVVATQRGDYEVNP